MWRYTQTGTARVRTWRWLAGHPPRARRWVCALLVVGVSAAPAAEYLQVDVQNVPVERVIASLDQQVSQDPRNVELLVNSARAHSMAFALKAERLPIAQGRLFLGFGVPDYTQWPVKATRDPKAEAQARAHLQKAIARYRDAIALAPENLTARIGLGWSLMHAGDRAAAVATLRDVVSRSWVADQSSRGPMHGQRFATEEAVHYLIPLLDPEKDRVEIETLRRQSRELADRPRWITPIAVPLEDSLSADDVLDTDAAVEFDVDGSGIPKRWTWIRPNAAWLVFDKSRRGQVMSGLQLFGSVTFWLFWQNGYHALRALDDDGDREIDGGELDGLALWHDRNSNGVSERGEVRPVTDWGIVSLSCVYEFDPTHPDEIAFAPAGVLFRDGTRRPTYDLILWKVRR